MSPAPKLTGSCAVLRLGGFVLACMLSTAVPAHAACPAAEDLNAGMLQGHWQAELAATATSPAEVWQLELAPHPDYPGSLRGVLVQGPLRFPVAADLDDGEFTMEESHDGRRIAATWLGEVDAGSCAQLLRGVRQIGSGGLAAQGFVLRRQSPR